MRLSRMLLGTSLALVAAAATVTMLPGPAAASGPAKYGWWYEANSGLPVSPPAPPQVPSDGLYVENGFNGPSAISALTFTVPSGAQLGPMTLKISGTATLTQAPVACSMSSASTDYKAAEGGSWTERPAFDCKKAQATGSVDSGRTAVTFNVDPFLANGAVAVVILAGGPADQVAFQKPDDSALQVTSGDVGAAPGVPSAGPGATSAAPDSSTGISNGATLSPDASPLPPVDSGTGAALAGPTGPAAPAGPPVAAPSSGTTSSGSRGYALARPTAATVRQGWRTGLATGLGLTAILIALIGWALGYGPLGGRALPLSVPLRAPSTQARQSGRRAQPAAAVDESRRPLA